MGATCRTVCVDCNAEAPVLGDYGMVGSPSLSTAKPRTRGKPVPFGYIYSGFAAIDLLPLELDRFRFFLFEHRGHRLRTEIDGDDSIGPDAEQEGSGERGAPNQLSPPQPVSEEDYHDALLEASCRQCGESFWTGASDYVRKQPPVSLSAERIDHYWDRVVMQLDEIYRAEPFSYEDLRSLGEFLRTHREHGPVLSQHWD